MYFTQRPRKLEVMQNGYSEHEIEAAIGEFGIVRIHNCEFASEAELGRLGPTDVELSWRDVDACQSLRSVAVLCEAPFPGLRADLEYLLADCVPHRRPDRFVALQPTNPVIEV